MTSLIVLQDCATIQLTKGQNTLVDAADWPELAKRAWHATKAHRGWYARTNFPDASRSPKFRTLTLQRVLMGEPGGLFVDHRDGDKLNNTRGNLRICNRIENGRNRRSVSGRSRFKGVSWRNRGSLGRHWTAQIHVGEHRKSLQLGVFFTEEEAADAYDEAALKHHGEFAVTNAQLIGEF